MYLGVCVCLAAVVAACGGERWRFPEEPAPAAAVRIDTKVQFLEGGSAADDDKPRRDSRVQSDEAPFREPTDTEGFYNRPPGAGRYPVRVEQHGQRAPHRQAVFPTRNTNQELGSDGTLDSLQYCKCLSTPDCSPRPDSARACGAGKFLCCYKRPDQASQQHTEFFNEIDDERPMILPGQESFSGHFPPAPGSEPNGMFGPGQAPSVGVLGAFDRPVRPQGHFNNPGVLVGPDGPSGVIGPARPAVLVGPGGPTGVIGPANTQGFIRPDGAKDISASETAQRGVLVGPGGPTGIIGPAGGYGRRPVLVGPGGPTGIIGPGRGGRRGVLVGPGGPTGIIGPGFGQQNGRGVLVGPGGPTGRIGPQYFG